MFLIFAMVVALLSAQASEASNIPGNVIMAKTSGNAVLIWNAGILLLDLKQRNTATASALNAVEASAVQILTQQSKSLAKAQMLSIKVIYPHTEEFNPKYGTLVMSSVEHLLVMTAKRSDLLREGSRWAEELRIGRKPQKLTVEMTGTLPPGW